MGFVWNLQDAVWDEMYRALIQFREKEHHCNVPRNWAENPMLAQWVTSRRQACRKHQLSKERVSLLEELGFVWDPYELAWERKFEALMAFHAVHHHCNVPVKWADDPSLGQWVVNQRQAYKKHKLSIERINRLEGLGFAWAF